MLRLHSLLSSVVVLCVAAPLCVSGMQLCHYSTQVNVLMSKLIAAAAGQNATLVPPNLYGFYDVLENTGNLTYGAWTTAGEDFFLYPSLNIQNDLHLCTNATTCPTMASSSSLPIDGGLILSSGINPIVIKSLEYFYTTQPSTIPYYLVKSVFLFPSYNYSLYATTPVPGSSIPAGTCGALSLTTQTLCCAYLPITMEIIPIGANFPLLNYFGIAEIEESAVTRTEHPLRPGGCNNFFSIGDSTNLTVNQRYTQNYALFTSFLVDQPANCQIFSSQTQTLTPTESL